MELHLENFVEFFSCARINQLDMDFLFSLSWIESDSSTYWLVVNSWLGSSANSLRRGCLELARYFSITSSLPQNFHLDRSFLSMSSDQSLVKSQDSRLIIINDCHLCLSIFSFQSFIIVRIIELNVEVFILFICVIVYYIDLDRFLCFIIIKF